MKLVTFEVETAVGRIRRIGVDIGNGIVDATAARIAFLESTCPAATASRVGAAQVPPDMRQLLASGSVGLDWVRESLEAVHSRGRDRTAEGQKTLYAPADIKLLAPIPRPAALSAFNAWPDHIKSANSNKSVGIQLGVPDASKGPQSYWKGNADSFVGPGTVLEPPEYATELDVECELVAIIGTGGKNLSVEQAEKAIAGYSIFNDVSAREIQFREMRDNRGPAKGKDFDGGNVLGPCIVTSDEIGDPRSLTLSLHVNGEQLSSATGENMAFSFPQIVSYLSWGQTLHAGHVITAGSYSGGTGLDLGRKFKPGDVIELRVAKIGSLFSTIGGKTH